MGLGKGDIIVWYRVTRHPQVFSRLTVSQWTPEFWEVTQKAKSECLKSKMKIIKANSKRLRSKRQKAKSERLKFKMKRVKVKFERLKSKMKMAKAKSELQFGKDGSKCLNMERMCDALKPGGPLTTRQPAETLVNVG